MKLKLLKLARFFHFISKRKYNEKRQIEVVKKSPLFDAKWYLAQNPDIKGKKMGAAKHYVKYGWKEGRNPSPKFDTNGYLSRYNDVKKANICPLLHYENYGKKEGRTLFRPFKEMRPTIWDNFVCKHKNKNPKISVVVASYNYQDYIQETLDSLLAQTYKNFEIIVVDDGSKDDSVKVIKKYAKKYPNIFLYRHHQGKNKGLPETVKLGVEKSTGEYIAFCEADDYWAPEHLEEKIKLLNKYSNPKIIINDVSIFGDKERVSHLENILLQRKNIIYSTYTKIKLSDFRLQNFISTFSCCMVKRCVLQKCNIVDVPRKANLDWWLWRQICAKNKIFYINKKLTFWRGCFSLMQRETIVQKSKQFNFVNNLDQLLLKKYPFRMLFYRFKWIKKENQYTLQGNSFYKNSKKLKYRPSFSFIMPTYNRAFCICDAVDSLLNQTYQNFELIIVDDGSTDNTKSILQQKYKKELENGKIRYIYKDNSGVCKTRNVGLKYAKNEWIAYLDSDNTIVDSFLETFCKYMLANKNCKTFYGKLIAQNTLNVVGKTFDIKLLLKRNYIDMGTFIHHRSLINELGGFDENMTRWVDYELITRYVKKYAPVFVDQIVLLYNDGEHERITNSASAVNNANYYKKKHCNYPVVTTMITCYNHENYITQAIDSAIRQTGDFVHEILISDDGSTDNTPQIIAEYAEKYPHLIRNISKKENVGISENMKRCFMEAKGKYIAVLEGDDYWSNNKKLEKQLNFLEKNKDCSMVFSRINLLNKSGKFQLLDRHNGLPNKLTGKHFIKELSLIVNFSCCMYRTDMLKKLPEVLYDGRLSEISLAFYLEKFGKIGFISTPLSVYRQHVNGVWSGTDRRKQLQSGLQCRQTAHEICRNKYKKQLKKIIDEQYIKPLNELENKLSKK